MNGNASASPIRPSASLSWVSSYICQPTTVPWIWIAIV